MVWCMADLHVANFLHSPLYCGCNLCQHPHGVTSSLVQTYIQYRKHIWSYLTIYCFVVLVRKHNCKKNILKMSKFMLICIRWKLHIIFLYIYFMKTHIFLKITVIFLFFSVIMPPSALDQLSKRMLIQNLLTKCPFYILFLALLYIPLFRQA